MTATDGYLIRHILASTSKRRLHGRAFRRELVSPNWWQRLLRRRYEPGSYVEFDKVSLDGALAALDEFLRDPLVYSIETAEGCRIDVALGKRADAFLDTWFSDGGIEDTTVAVADLRPLVELIYATTSDREIAAWLSAHETRAPC